MPHSSTARRLVAGLAVSIVLAAGPVMAEKSGASTAQATVPGAVPDPLDSPARSTPKALSAVLTDISRAGARLVVVGERGAILLSDDNGTNWRQASAVPVSVALTSVRFANDRHGIAVGHSGVILTTADGGEHWERRLDGRRIIDLALAEAAAVAASAPGSVLSERLARDARRLQADGPDKPLLGVHMLDARRGWAIGAYGLALLTEDGGENWASVMGRLPNEDGNHLYAMAKTGLGLTVVGEMGTVFRSTDEGRSFERVETPYEGSFFGILPVADGGTLAFGLRGNAWLGRAGDDWQKIDLEQAATLTGGLTLPDGSHVLADETGRLYRGAADGTQFSLMNRSDSASLSALAIAPDNGLVATGLRGARRVPLQPDSGFTAPSSTDSKP